jgi:effector-binding domain-containing protein
MRKAAGRRRPALVATYTVSQISLKRQNAAVIREMTTLANLGSALSEILMAVSNYLKEIGVQPAGPPFARYYAVSSGGVDLEAGFPVQAEVPKRWRIVSDKLPGGPAAATWHLGAYEKISEAYEAIDEWVKTHGARRTGPPWEVYWTDPSEVADESKWRTQVVQPLAP